MARTSLVQLFLCCALASGTAPAEPVDERGFAEAVASYRAGRASEAYGRFHKLAQQGDADAARIALFMLRHGPILFGTYWDASTEDVQDFTRLAVTGAQRMPPEFVPVGTPTPRRGKNEARAVGMKANAATEAGRNAKPR